MRKLILAAMLLAPIAAHAQTASDYLAACKHRAEVVAPESSPRYRQVVLGCMHTEIDRIDAHTAALNAYAACLTAGGTPSSCNR
jgi:hypothetical protein